MLSHCLSTFGGGPFGDVFGKRLLDDAWRERIEVCGLGDVQCDVTFGETSCHSGPLRLPAPDELHRQTVFTSYVF